MKKAKGSSLILATLMIFTFVACEDPWGRVDPPAGNQKKVSQDLIQKNQVKSDSSISFEENAVLPFSYFILSNDEV